MGELGEKLNAILGDRQAMDQIMALAESLGQSAPPAPRKGEEREEAGRERGQGGAGAQEGREPPQEPLGGLDPRLLQLGARLWQEYRAGDQPAAQLLQALRPFLRRERQDRLDRAVELTRLSHVLRVALQALGERGEEGV